MSGASPALVRTMRRTKEADRPRCPACHAHSPPVTSDDHSTEWLRAWGHRCPHGEPCPAWSENMRTCGACASETPRPRLVPPPSAPAIVAPASPAAPKRRAPRPKGNHYECICVSMYVEDLARLDQKVDTLKAAGHRRMTRSALIRYALDRLSVDDVPKPDGPR